jgi:hypothetical protein
MSDKSPVSLNPKTFSDSYLVRKSAEYIVPAETERRSKFSVSGFPTKLLNAIYFTIPPRFEGKWYKSLANVERFLLSVGAPLLDKATEGCCKFTEMMSDAVDTDDDNKQIQLRSLRFLYSVDDMRIAGGKEIDQGGVAIQCLERDVQLVKDIQIRLGRTGITQSSLVVLVILWALSTDNDCQIVSSPIHKMCQQVVMRFREKVVIWEEELCRFAK